MKRARNSQAAGTLPGELALIEAIRRQAGGASSRILRLGIGDDCAVLRPASGREICVTTDFSLEGVHFRRDWHPPQSIGHRCLARGLSDLAAMGAEPVAVFLSLALPARLPAEWLRGFLQGFLSLARAHGVPLAGGDTAQSPAAGRSHRNEGKILADIVAIGQLPRGQARLRSGARPGDRIYVTGALGGAAAELLALSKHPARFRSHTHAPPNSPHLYPQPRLAIGRKLRSLATSMIDISDGLSTDLAHLCRASGLSALIDETALPIHPVALGLLRSRTPRTPSPLDLALHGGEDYELLFTASPSVTIPASIAGLPIHPIGAMRRGAARRPEILLIAADGLRMPITPAGWQHFHH